MFANFDKLRMSAEQESYKCRKLQHWELLESYERKFQILTFVPLERVSILQITAISESKRMAKHTAVFQLVYFCRSATFSRARHAVTDGVGSLDDRGTPNVLRGWASKAVVKTCSYCTSMIGFRCLDDYVNTKLLAHLGLLSNALALRNGGGAGGVGA